MLKKYVNIVSAHNVDLIQTVKNAEAKFDKKGKMLFFKKKERKKNKLLNVTFATLTFVLFVCFHFE